MNKHTLPTTRGTLEPREAHPSAYAAQRYLGRVLTHDKMALHIEAFASCAISGNRLADVCLETLTRLRNREPISDRYLLGLAWAIRDIEEEDE